MSSTKEVKAKTRTSRRAMGIGDEMPFLDNPEAKFTEMNRRAKEEVERRRKADERAAALRAAIHQAAASAPSTPSGGNQGRAQSPFRAPSPGFVLPGQSPIPGPFRYPYKEMQEVEGNQGGDGPPLITKKPIDHRKIVC